MPTPLALSQDRLRDQSMAIQKSQVI